MEKLELEILRTNSLSLENAKSIANQIEKDPTVGGLFPNAESGDFTTVDEVKFKSRWCFWWKVARPLLKLAKIFTGNKGDAIIDSIMKTGNVLCN